MECFRKCVGGYHQQLNAALFRRDWKHVKEIAHPIKYHVMAFGFPQVIEKAQMLCDACDANHYEDMGAFARGLLFEIENVLSK